MAQALGGYLWLGTTDGLVRFDGDRFTYWGDEGEPALPGLLISDLLASRDGSLWVAYGDAGAVTRIQARGQARHYTAREGPLSGPIWTILEDQAGTIWAGGRQGLAALRGGEWRPIGPAMGLPAAEVSSLHQDDSGAIWVGTSVGIYRLAPDRTQFELHDSMLRRVQDFSQDRSGTIWVTDQAQAVRSITGGRPPVLSADVSPPVGAFRLLSDGDGDVWVAALGSGLFRLHPGEGTGPAVVERFQYEQKFAGGAAGGARSLFADDEGNVWVGMRGGGLLRISRTRFERMVPLEGITSDGIRAIASADDGSVWVATGRRVTRFRGQASESYPVAQAMAIYPLAGSEVLLATVDGLSRYVRGRFEPLPVAAEPALSRLSEMATGRDGDLWLCGTDGLTRLGEGDAPGFDEDVRRKPCRSLLSDTRERLWAGFGDGSLAVLEGSRWRYFTAADGLARGGIVKIFEDTRGAVWVSTRGGLSLYADGRFLTLAAGRDLPTGIVPLLLEDRQGWMWLGAASGAGLVRFAKGAFEAAAASKSSLSYDYYDESDGMNGQLLRVISPSGVLAADGRLWVSSGAGVVVVDPSSLPAPPRVKAPLIERVIVDGEHRYPAGDSSLPAGTSALDVRFTSVSLSAAQRLHFRYALDPVDRAWTFADGQRRVTYTRLRPGSYQLRIQAGTEGGAWSPESTWSFIVEPRFYETPVFYASIALCGIGAIWAAWRSHVRRVRHEYELVAAERSRVGREIHDNLLQNCVAVGWELEVLASECDEANGVISSESLRKLGLQMRQCIFEARRSIWQLRAPGLDGQDLLTAIRNFADTVAASSSITVTTNVLGTPRRCDKATEEQLLFIAMEAIRNASRHSAADRVEVVVDFEDDAITITVRDNGRGFVVSDAAGEWHWGIKHMQERASRIGGRVEIESVLDRGTVVKVAAPSEAPA